jgi:hypothetical protein
MTPKLNREELQNEISNLYYNNINCFVKSIPNGEIKDILKKQTKSLVIVYESMLKDVELFLSK